MIERKLVYDDRGGQMPRWVSLPEGVNRLMQVPDAMRKSVIFLYCVCKGELRPAGTAFCAGYPVPRHPTRALPILLTAQHVIAKVRIHSDDQKILLRINRVEGAAEFYETSVDDWHDDGSSVDCAALGWMPDLDVFDARPWLIKTAATSDYMTKEGIGLGDEVFMVGLFRNHLGQDRNEPIIRVGNIAGVPADPISTKHFGPMRAILIEARSIGGLSGSPVFVHMGFSRWREGQIMHWAPSEPLGATGPFVFLGLMHGHWEADEADIDALLAEDEAADRIHTGIGVVTPAEQIMSLLDGLLEGVAEMRAKKLDEDNQPTEDDAIRDEPEEFERFEDLTRKLVNTPKETPEGES